MSARSKHPYKVRFGSTEPSDPRAQRPAPYTPGDSSGQWGHDLFGEGSHLYNPAVNVGAAAAQSSAALQSNANPSLAPFGQATPALPHQAQTNGAGAGSARRKGAKGAATSSAPPTLLARLGMGVGGGSSGKLIARLSGGAVQMPQAPAAPTQTRAQRNGGGVGPQRTQRAREREAPVVRPAPAAPVVPPSRPRAAALNDPIDLTMDDATPPPPMSIKHRAAPASTAVIVRNLAEGTTAEDVEAAFNEFGEIVSCEMDKLATGGKLSARVAFRLMGDAERAIKRLQCVCSRHLARSCDWLLPACRLAVVGCVR